MRRCSLLMLEEELLRVPCERETEVAERELLPVRLPEVGVP